jgi:hypothetical protein
MVWLHGNDFNASAGEVYGAVRDVLREPRQGKKKGNRPG